ncbi:hypothetical protein [Pandoravirus japonicus]|uniref:Uncharacterized protein n=1 Tax=Pandoravirus japonicus TaxID=2823154 RepID=A0A811BLJ5_9VIRU|nr:hypothetical protein [Pandoravirus japonicus]
MEGRRICRSCCASPARHRTGWTASARACLCVYSGVALIAALVEAYLWRTRGALGLLSACRGTGPWPLEPAPPTPGTCDSLWSTWPACLLVGFGAGALWPAWTLASLAILVQGR